VWESRFKGLAYETARLKLARIRVEGRQSRQKAYEYLARVSCDAVNVDRVALFTFVNGLNTLSHECTYGRLTGRYEEGPRLGVERCGSLPAALQERRVLTIDREEQLVELGDFALEHLRPFNVKSLMCAPVIREGKVTGLISFESTRPLRFSQEQLSFAGSAADLTALILEQADRTELEAALHVSSELQHENAKMQALVRLSKTVAHDLNGLLSVVDIVALELSKMNRDELPQRAIDLKGVVSMGRALTQSLLTFSADEPPLDVFVDLDEEVNHMLSVVGPWFTGPFRLTFDKSTERTRARVDRLSFQQVMLNLMKNARDALDSKGTVVVRLRDPQPDDALRVGAVILEVEDDGQGMDETTQAKAAEPYFTTKPQGHGLGLSSVFGIVQRYGGGIRLTSKVGEGTRVAVAFQRK